VDTGAALGVAEPPDPEKCNDYVAAMVRADPARFIGFASVNPAWRGSRAAMAEFRRALMDLGLAALKLYPCTSTGRRLTATAFPVYQAAGERGIPVMIHQAGATRIEPALELGRPALLDDVGCASATSA
jgi:predicted TIM-barrel fold metal-dependent hydrolase